MLAECLLRNTEEVKCKHIVVGRCSMQLQQNSQGQAATKEMRIKCKDVSSLGMSYGILSLGWTTEFLDLTTDIKGFPSYLFLLSTAMPSSSMQVEQCIYFIFCDPGIGNCVTDATSPWPRRWACPWEEHLLVLLVQARQRPPKTWGAVLENMLSSSTALIRWTSEGWVVSTKVNKREYAFGT